MVGKRQKALTGKILISVREAGAGTVHSTVFCLLREYRASLTHLRIIPVKQPLQAPGPIL